MPQPLITLIAGATASGKSRLALEMARATDAVILNADSQQLYADLRVLSARPSAEEEARAEHRLYGVADAADAWSVGRWTRTVMPVLEALQAEGRPAIIVGGEKAAMLAEQRANFIALAKLDDAQLEIMASLPPAGKPRNAVSLVVEAVEIFLPLEGMVDVSAERARMEKQLAEVEAQIGRLEGLLASDFASKAPASVVQKERDKLAGLADSREKLLAQLASA